MSSTTRFARPGTVMLISLGAAAITFGTTLPTWVIANVHNSLTDPRVEIAGSDAAPAASSLALVILAASIAIRIAGPQLRWVISAIMGIAALGMIFSIFSVASDPSSATLTEVGKVTGMADSSSEFTLTFWPWLALFMAVLLLLNAFWTAFAARSWSVRRKYERNLTDTTEDLDEIDTWDSFSAGNDPTDREVPSKSL